MTYGMTTKSTST